MTASALLIALLLGQTQASVWGTVRDSETGTAVVGATVEIVDASRISRTDSAGSYALSGVPAGARHLRISSLGYKSRTLHVFVPVDGDMRLDVALEPEPIRLQSVTARSAGRPVRTETEFGVDRVQRVGSRTITQWDVRSHPGLAEPDFFEALGGQGVLLDPESPSGLHVRGGSSDQNLFLLDGVPIHSPYHAAGHFSALNPDAISRVDLHSVVAPSAWDGALSGVVDARTQAPGTDRVRVRGAVTAASARLAADGPLPFGAGALLSARWGHPGFFAPPGENSYVRGSFSDGLAKVEAPIGGGRVEVLAFTSDNNLRVASVPTRDGEKTDRESDRADVGFDDVQGQNLFRWKSRSYGLGWEKPLGERTAIQARLWRADLDVASYWLAADGPLSMSSRRRTYGSRLILLADGRTSSSRLGFGVERDHTSYFVVPRGTGGLPTESLVESRGEPEVFAAFAEHQRNLSDRVQVLLGLRGSFMAGKHPRLAPRLSLHWPISSSFTVSAGYARTHQWVQSLRNPESLIDNLFNPSLPVAAEGNSVPVAQSAHFGLAIMARPVEGVSAGLEGYTRVLKGLVLVAPATGQPFAVDGYAVGRARAWGGGVNVELAGARYRALVDYGFGAVSYDVGSGAYRPGFAVSHSLAASVGYYPSATLEVRSALRAEFGRPTTLVEGAFEWEACSIIDGGCEVEGSPQEVAGPLGGSRLPAYARVDIGVRKHWHWRLRGRDGVLTGFITLSNVLGRRNLLAYTIDPATGELARLPMRPFSPLTVGLEWSF
ncbi:MAG: TonB-dependent receptor [Gemmatimonadota bacterium]|nr:MAG: TonB-dependent receptor [Gemmatimonadota bacterium]